jgi:hypothetical protein
MKLNDLHPECTPVHGTHRYLLAFDCAQCGRPYRIFIQFHRGAHQEGIWSWVSPGDVPDMGTLSLIPSIHFHTHGPRHPTCGWHVHIIDGVVRPG